MALVVKKLWEVLLSTQKIFTDLADKRVEEWYLMGSPLAILFIVALYCIFVFDIGKRFMNNRQPFDLKYVLIVYNFVQVILCSYIVIAGFIPITKFNIHCEPVNYGNDPESLDILYIFWVYFVLKIIDLLDTVFFILRKKYNQISFLHVYHHAIMVIITWGGIKFLAGGHSIYLVYINSFVHIIMYSYYLISAWNEDYKKSVWWKKHITQLQLVQFFTLLVIYIPLLFYKDCTFPKSIIIILTPQVFIMLILFSNFYYHAYIKSNKNKIK